MTDLLLRVGISNAFCSLALAALAMTAGATCRRPHVAHVLWLLVLIKLVTPPLVSIPVPLLTGGAIAKIRTVQGTEALLSHPDGSGNGGIDARSEMPLQSELGARLRGGAQILLSAVWLAGCGIMCLGSLVRAFRFDRLLRRRCSPAPRDVQAAAERVAGRLGLKRVPVLSVASARLSPMVWWIGGRVRVVLPESALRGASANTWQWVLAHELAHVRRRDYLVRWLEWVSSVVYWWNPVVWWAQRNLRAAEELCCDAMVLSSLRPEPRVYARALLHAVEQLARPDIRLPSMVSGVDSGGGLERRFRRILSGAPIRIPSAGQRACVLVSAAAFLPIGLAWGPGAGAAAGMAPDILRDPEAWLSTTGEYLEQAMETGRMSSDEAWAEWCRRKEREVAAPLMAAVRDGGMSKARAGEIWREVLMAEAAGRLRAGVEQGILTESQARARWAAILEVQDHPEDGTLLESAAYGRVDGVGRHLRTGADPNTVFVQEAVMGHGGAALHLAVLSDHVDVARLLLESRADPNLPARDKHGGSPLHWAAAAGRLASTRLLMDAGADVNARDRNGYTPLDATGYEPWNNTAGKRAVAGALRAEGALHRDELAQGDSG